jgi:hypothetical protein
LFLSTEGFWKGAAQYIVRRALIAAVLAPFMFGVLRRAESSLEKLQPAAQ